MGYVLNVFTGWNSQDRNMGKEQENTVNGASFTAFFNFIRSILIRFWYFKKFLQFQSQSWNICFLFKRRKLSIDGLKSYLNCDLMRDLGSPSWRWWSGVDSHLLKF